MFEENNTPSQNTSMPSQDTSTPSDQVSGMGGVKLIESKPPKSFKLDKNLIMIGVAVLAIIVTGFLVFNNSNLRLGFGNSPETVAKKAVDYINSIQNQEATLLSFSQESGVIKIRISIGGREFDSYVTKDGKFLFPEVVKIDSESASASQDNASLENIRPVTSEDRIRGDTNAPIKIVEYSDTECPFCKRFH